MVVLKVPLTVERMVDWKAAVMGLKKVGTKASL